MPDGLLIILTSVGTLLVNLIVTFCFNKVVAIPKAVKKQKEFEEAQTEKNRLDNQTRDAKIAALEAAVSAYPAYRAQSLQIQQQLQCADSDILKACNDIKQSVLDNQNILNDRLDRLEKREKNSIRAKLLDEYRLFTDATKNPMFAWSEMEHHAFFELVRDYEDLNGNDYVHSTVIPAVNELAVIPMTDKKTLAELMQSRKL